MAGRRGKTQRGARPHRRPDVDPRSSAFMFSLMQSQSASAHCDSVDGPVVAAAREALEANDVTRVQPHVKPETEAELMAAFEHTVSVRAHGGEAQDLADRYFFETAVRLHRAGEGARYTGLKEAVEPDPRARGGRGGHSRAARWTICTPCWTARPRKACRNTIRR